MPPPNVWGPIYWNFLHSVITLYPEKPIDTDKDNFIVFINAFRNLLPCKECRDHFLLNLNKFPLTTEILSSRDSLILWGISMHNVVRTMLKKNIYYNSTRESVEIEKRKYKIDDMKKKLGTVMQISLNEISLNFKKSSEDFANIFNSVNKLMIQNNVDMSGFFANKKININFDVKNNVLRIAQMLR
jgi:hypothetical protein